MKVLIAPLNWGLGHATRCVPIVRQYIAKGDEVVVGGDGMSLLLLRKTFPMLRYIEFSSLQLRYSAGKRQTWAMLQAIPQLIRSILEDHALLEGLLMTEHFDCIISDNRFGLWLPADFARSQNVRTIYITHQLFIRFPHPWRWLEPVAYWLHKKIWDRYDEVWIPDVADSQHNLSGELSHKKGFCHPKIKYIGSLSRLKRIFEVDNRYDVVAILSGLEPQRTLLERELINRYLLTQESVLILRGKMDEPNTRIQRGLITLLPYLGDAELTAILQGSKHIICRSGYTSVMDMNALGVMEKVEWIPTPGQTEQEYLAQHLMSSLKVGTIVVSK